LAIASSTAACFGDAGSTPGGAPSANACRWARSSARRSGPSRGLGTASGSRRGAGVSPADPGARAAAALRRRDGPNATAIAPNVSITASRKTTTEDIATLNGVAGLSRPRARGPDYDTRATVDAVIVIADASAQGRGASPGFAPFLKAPEPSKPGQHGADR